MSFQFVPWSRRGSGAQPPAVAAAGSRRIVTATVQVSADRTGQPHAEQPATSAPLALLGPGDVVGIDPAQVVRRSPRPDDHQFEPNYLPAIEFAHPDLPWMFSPAAEVSADRAQPWLMLVVICTEAGHVQGRIDVRAGSPNPVLRVDDVASLPSPADAWAWAHVQVHAPTAAEAGSVLATPSPAWSAVRSRIVAPTHLDPGRQYTACLVPVYEAGRRAGLGLPDEGVGIEAWAPAAGLLLPVYDRWTFRTGPAGDFETLARKLKPVDSATLQGLGQRLVAVEPAAALMEPAAAGADVFPPSIQAVPTAIAKADVPGPLGLAAAGTPGVDELHARLKVLVDIVAQAADDPEPIVGPPLYGQWHAAVTSLDGAPGVPGLAPPPAGTAQAWVEELNVDPHLRMGSGIATRVVGHDQEQLMADAWSQLDAVFAANRRIRWAQLFAASGDRLHARLGLQDGATALRLANPALARLRAADGITVRASIDSTNVPRAVLGPAFARAARYTGRPALGEAVAGAVSAAVRVAIDGFRTGAPDMMPSRFIGPRIADPGVVRDVLATPDLADRVRTNVGVDAGEFVARLEDSAAIVDRIAAQVGEEAGPGHGQGHGQGGLAGRGSVRIRIAHGSPAEQQIRDLVAFARKGIEAGTVRLDPAVRRDVEEFQGQHGGVIAESAALAPATIRALNAIAAGRAVEGAPRPLDLAGDGVRISVSLEDQAPIRDLLVHAGINEGAATVLATTQELRSVVRSSLGIGSLSVGEVADVFVGADQEAMRADIRALDRGVVPSSEPLAVPALAAFSMETAAQVVVALAPVPAYQKLLEYSHRITPSVAGLVKQRTPFHPVMAAPQFPAPMVDRLKSVDQEWVLGGVGRLPANSICLLAANWRFVEAFLAGANHEMARELLWRGYPTDLRGSYFRRFWPSVDPATGAARDDVIPVHEWLGPVGTHEATPGELTIVVLKGDLLRRYPSTIVTAELGRTSAVEGDTTFTNDGPVARELFRDFLDPDVTYVALDVPIAKLHERPDDDPRHGWYLSLRQPLDEPRFGMDEASAPGPPANADLVGPAGVDLGKADDWTWQGLAPGVGRPHLTPAGVFAHENSALVAAGLFQRPFRLLLRAADYLPGGDGNG